ncbi:hypothetical protein B0T24DRAFT_691775 [Lasiosphaeria ovina]|uniref:Alcohol dehydrogenase-like N-terminal domain-containing protein n=1 Tax=Lasiosphaeria ovina TaxID=92902 RepID=A0AAE0JU16_9PEZI|nr:hypothetical protein B0T24DRAFT_691775 [Lasiosphaeria ovina]
MSERFQKTQGFIESISNLTRIPQDINSPTYRNNGCLATIHVRVAVDGRKAHHRRKSGLRAGFATSPHSLSSPSPKHNTLIKVLRVSLNQQDYKLPAIPLVALFSPLPAVPATDFVERVVATTRDGDFAPGDLVVGKRSTPSQHGFLAEYVIVGPGDACIKVGEAAVLDSGATKDDILDALASIVKTVE